MSPNRRIFLNIVATRGRSLYALVNGLFCKMITARALLLLSAVFFVVSADMLVIYEDLTSGSVGLWLAIARNIIVYFMLIIGLLLLSGKYAAWLWCMAWPILVIIEFLEWFSRLHFGMLVDGDWIGLLLSTSKTEIEEFFGMYSFFGWIFCVLAVTVVVVAGFILGLTLQSRRNFSKWAFVLLFPFVFCGVLGDVFLLRVGGGLPPMTAYMFMKDTCAKCSEMRNFAQVVAHPQLPERLSFADNVKRENPVFLLVIGESATRNNWGAYGYERDTTPTILAKKEELVIFEDVVSSAIKTVESLRFLLTGATFENPENMKFTLPEIAKRAGYTTVLLEGQSRFGRVDFLGSFMFAACMEKVYVYETDAARQGRIYDDCLIPYFRETLMRHVNDPLFVIAQLRGSHVQFAERYPVERKVFSDDYVDTVNKSLSNDGRKTLNQYDNSIRFTDFVLEQFIDLAANSGRPVALMYLSDHGESPRGGGWRNGMDLDCWEIPMFIWFSRKYQELHPDIVLAARAAAGKPLQQDQLLPGMISLSLIKWDGVNGTNDFLSDEFEVRSQRFINKGARLYKKSQEPSCK